MIEFYSEADFELLDQERYARWVQQVFIAEGKACGEIVYIFLGDEELLTMNRSFLKHDYYTDIITFDNSGGELISGDIYISVDRVRENALAFKESFESELLRVMAHGVLHLIGYRDKTPLEVADMRKAEDRSIKLFHVER